MTRIEKFEQRMKFLEGEFADMDFVELLIAAKCLQKALEYRAQIEEIQETARRIANEYN